MTSDVQVAPQPKTPAPKDGVSVQQLKEDQRKKEANRNVSFNKTVNRKRPSSISITGMLQEKKKEEEAVAEEDNRNKPADKFGIDDLHKKWTNYANKMKVDGKSSLFATLTKHMPTMAEGHMIEFVIDNAVQEEQLATERLDLMDYLRKELNNYQLNLKTILNKTEQGSALYTTRDKFEKMAEKNPALNKLRDLLKLDLDY